ncbi:cytochrome P450 [Xylogone sp. PMI_703]|nr:cytochrome P450 [Xylogone sp. PMI_703]
MSITGFVEACIAFPLWRLAVAGVIASCCAWVIYCRFFHHLSNVPGPFWASILSIWGAVQVWHGNIQAVQRQLHKKFGPIVRISPSEVSISDPQAIKSIYGIKSGYVKIRNEKLHAERRRFVNSMYSMTAVLESERHIDSCSDIFLSKMNKYADTGTAVDLGEWSQWSGNTHLERLFFGRRFGFLDDEHDWDNAIERLDTLWFRSIVPLAAALSPTVRAAVVGFEKIRSTSRKVVQERQYEVESGKIIDRNDFLNKLFTLRDTKKGWGVPDTESEITSAFLAGSDTTAIAIRSILYHLMKTPPAMNRLVDELMEATASGKLSSKIRYDEALKLPFLVACIKEGFRTHPPVSMSMPRYVPRGGAMLSGRFFPEDSRVGINAAVVQYDTDGFGDDADQFVPERWFRPNAEAMERCMMHFGQGSRTCLGKNISLAEIHKIVPELIRQFRLELIEPGTDWKIHTAWFSKQGGILIRVYKR